MNTSNRRTLKFREFAAIQQLARWLSQRQITPNQISIASMVFALLGCIAFFLMPRVSATTGWLLPIGAAVCIQCRLLCNLFDGLVAIEGGKQTPSGELFNDVPDRVSDSLLLVGAGYAVTIVEWGSTLGWSAALLAALTAYIRTLAASMGAPVNFQGPMAKQHRMALLTAGSLASAAEWYFTPNHYAIFVALVIINLGCCVTLYRRTLTAYRFMERHDRA